MVARLLRSNAERRSGSQWRLVCVRKIDALVIGTEVLEMSCALPSIYIRAYIYIYIYVYIYIHIHTRANVQTCIFLHMHMQTCVYVYI